MDEKLYASLVLEARLYEYCCSYREDHGGCDGDCPFHKVLKGAYPIPKRCNEKYNLSFYAERIQQVFEEVGYIPHSEERISVLKLRVREFCKNQPKPNPFISCCINSICPFSIQKLGGLVKCCDLYVCLNPDEVERILEQNGF